MNIALWIVQILLALAFAAAGFMKVTQPIANLSNKGSFHDNFPLTPLFIRQSSRPVRYVYMVSPISDILQEQK